MVKARKLAGIFFAVLFLSQAVVALAEPWLGIATSILLLLCAFFKIFWDIISVLAVVVILAAAVQWIISRDDPAKRKQALDIIIAVIIGLILAMITITVIDEVAKALDLPTVYGPCKLAAGP